MATENIHTHRQQEEILANHKSRETFHKLPWYTQREAAALTPEFFLSKLTILNTRLATSLTSYLYFLGPPPR